MNRIKKARLMKGVTQSELAKEIGVSSVTVSKWENGLMSPTVTRLKTVADVLGVRVEELIKQKVG